MFAGREMDETYRTLFSRWGRGVSYHDFVLGFEIPPPDLPVVSCLTLYLRRRFAEVFSLGAVKYEKVLRSMLPSVHPCFFCGSLDLIFRKP
jgi:hypothetical protein